MRRRARFEQPLEIAIVATMIALTLSLLVVLSFMTPERYGAGPALLKAIADGWKPAPPPRKP